MKKISLLVVFLLTVFTCLSYPYRPSPTWVYSGYIDPRDTDGGDYWPVSDGEFWLDDLTVGTNKWNLTAWNWVSLKLDQADAEWLIAQSNAVVQSSIDTKQSSLGSGGLTQFLGGDLSWHNWASSDWTASSGPSSIANKPTLGTAASQNSTAFATATQGATADSALQPNGNGSGLSGITKSQVGLGNADNTSDANKPVSSAQAAADAATLLAAQNRTNHYGAQAQSTIIGLVTALAAKFDAPSGNTSQVVLGNGTLGTLPSGNLVNTNFSSTAIGTSYTVTATPSKVTFGTTSPSVTVASAGTYLLVANFRYDFVGATFLLNRTATSTIRRTNNTAADITNGSKGWILPVTTLLSQSAFDINIITTYTTSNSNDVLELYSSVTSAPSVGSFVVSEANLIAVKLY